MQIDASTVLTDALGSSNADDSSANQATIDKRFAALLDETKQTADARDTLTEITKGGANGYWNWKVKQMKAHITQEVMGSMDMTPDKLAAMSATDRTATEDKIMHAVEERLKVAIDNQMKKKQMDVMGSAATMSSVLQHSQDVTAIF